MVAYPMPNYPTAHETVIYARDGDGWRFVNTTDPYYAATLGNLADFRIGIEEIDQLELVVGERILVEIWDKGGETLASVETTVKYISELDDTDVKVIAATCGDYYECACGNNPVGGAGFDPCTHAGRAIDPNDMSAMAEWDVRCIMCMECGLVMDQDSYDGGSHTVAVIGRSRVFAGTGKTA